MKSSRRELLMTGLTLPALGLWIDAVQGQEGALAPTGNAPAGPSEDPPLAAKLLVESRRQITTGQVAVQRADNWEVRAFATAEVAEHQLIQRRLADRGLLYPTVTPIPAAVAGTAPVDAIAGVPGNPPPAPTANRPVVPQPGTRPAKNAVPPPPPVVTPPPAADPRVATPLVNVGRFTLPAGESRLMVVDVQVGDQCIATFQREIAPLTGPAFDRAYVNDQLFAHFALLDRVTVFRRYASPVLLGVLNEAQPVIERHIATLKALMARLEVTR
jgi:predicted outer membrane protein